MVESERGLGTGIYYTFTSYHVAVKMCSSKLSSPLALHKESAPSEAGSSSLPHRSGKQIGTHQQGTTELTSQRMFFFNLT